MFTVLSVASIVIGALSDKGKGHDCQKQKMPQDMYAEMTSWDGQKLDNFYVIPDSSQNAVIRIRNFGQSACSKANIDIYNGPRVNAMGKPQRKIDGSINEPLKPQFRSWITIEEFEYDEIVFSVHPNKKQWDRLFFDFEKDEIIPERLFTLSVLFSGETFDIPLTLKRAHGFVKYAPKQVGDTRTFSLHCYASDQCKNFEIWQKNGAEAIATDVASIDEQIAVINDMQNPGDADGTGKITLTSKQSDDPNDGQITAIYNFKYNHDQETFNGGESKEYYVKHDGFKQFVYHTIAPLRWSLSLDDYYKNAEGIVQKYEHVDVVNQRMSIMPNFWHKIRFHIPGLRLSKLDKLSGLMYWRKPDSTKTVNENIVIVDHDNKALPQQPAIKAPDNFDFDKNAKQPPHKGKFFGGLECGGDKSKTAISGKVSKGTVNFVPNGQDGVFKEDKYSKEVTEKRQIKTHYGMFLFELKFGEKDSKTKELIESKSDTAFGYIHFVIDNNAQPVYRVVKPLGSGKIQGDRLFPIRGNNQFVYGTNQEFKQSLSSMNAVQFPMVQGMPNSQSIQCVGKCPQYTKWLYNIEDTLAKTDQDKVSPFEDRLAQSESKWAAINNKYGFYVLDKLDYDQKRDANKDKEELLIKTVTVNANPWSAFKKLKFQLYYTERQDDVIGGSLEVDQDADAKIIEFEAIVDEWNAAGKFWAGLFSLFAIIVAQILSCVYMAKRNAKKSN